MRTKRSAPIILISLALLLVLNPLAGAEDQPEPEPQIVEISAEDGLLLVGEYYAAGAGRPAVLLLHQLYTTRRSWKPLIVPLLDAGFNVLAVDLRGYGATQGRIDWQKAVEDVVTWAAWLRSAAETADVAVIGSSMGSNLALVGCAHDPRCRTAIAISPGLNYYGVRTGPALAEGLRERSALLIYSARDRYSAVGVPQMAELATGEIHIQRYDGNVHGMDLFQTQGKDLIPRIIDWLQTH